MVRTAMTQSGAGNLGPTWAGRAGAARQSQRPKDSGKERRKTGPCLSWGRPHQWQSPRQLARAPAARRSRRGTAKRSSFPTQASTEHSSGPTGRQCRASVRFGTCNSVTGQLQQFKFRAAAGRMWGPKRVPKIVINPVPLGAAEILTMRAWTMFRFSRIEYGMGSRKYMVRNRWKRARKGLRQQGALGQLRGILN